MKIKPDKSNNIKKKRLKRPLKQRKTTINNKKAMIEILKKSMGNVTIACSKVGISRITHYEWFNKDIEYKKQVEEIYELVLDFAESALHRGIKDGNMSAVFFFLKCKGKGRGYIERQELEHSGSINSNTKINFIWGKKKSVKEVTKK